MDKKGDGKYWYLLNPSVTKAISLVFKSIDGINKQYGSVVNMKDRIHFYDDLEHAMIIKGSNKGVVNYRTNSPILGIVYDSVHQFLEQDKVLLVNDKRNAQHGSLVVTPLVLRKPYVTCVNEQSAIARYLKFVVTTRKIKWRFSVKINGLGVSKYVQPTWYVVCWCFAIAFFVVIISYCFMKQAEVHRTAGKVGIELGHTERVDEDDHENT